MAKYTTQLRTIVESYSYGNYNLSTTDKIKKAIPKIFDFTFPIWNDAYTKILEEKIIRHYYTKEIGLETVALWKFYLEERLNLIMPYYNQLYATTVKDYDYLTNTKLTETVITDNNNTTTVANTILNSDTPQANYDGLDYATNLEDIKGTTSDNGKNNLNRTTVGNNGGRSFDSLVMEHRETLLNIDNMIIDELKDLFMMIY